MLLILLLGFLVVNEIILAWHFRFAYYLTTSETTLSMKCLSHTCIFLAHLKYYFFIKRYMMYLVYVYICRPEVIEKETNFLSLTNNVSKPELNWKYKSKICIVIIMFIKYVNKYRKLNNAREYLNTARSERNRRHLLSWVLGDKIDGGFDSLGRVQKDSKNYGVLKKKFFVRTAPWVIWRDLVWVHDQRTFCYNQDKKAYDISINIIWMIEVACKFN